MSYGEKQFAVWKFLGYLFNSYDSVINLNEFSVSYSVVLSDKQVFKGNEVYYILLYLQNLIANEKDDSFSILVHAELKNQEAQEAQEMNMELINREDCAQMFVLNEYNLVNIIVSLSYETLYKEEAIRKKYELYDIGTRLSYFRRLYYKIMNALYPFHLYIYTKPIADITYKNLYYEKSLNQMVQKAKTDILAVPEYKVPSNIPSIAIRMAIRDLMKRHIYIAITKEYKENMPILIVINQENKRHIPLIIPGCTIKVH